MTRTSSPKIVPDDFWRGQLTNAVSFHTAARTLLDLHEAGQNTNPIIVQVVDAAIAYADAVTARYGNRVNQQDHQALGSLLRAVLGNRLPAPQLTNLRTILSERDAASYGIRVGTYDQALRLFERLEAFAAWAQAELAR